VPSEQEQRAATASQFVAALGGAIRHADLDDVDRRRRADRTAAVAGGDPADVVTEQAGAS
jgi:hypothetical protein